MPLSVEPELANIELGEISLVAEAQRHPVPELADETSAGSQIREVSASHVAMISQPAAAADIIARAAC
ncbi:hypothetical protein GCM10010532_107960 [Dactylosporangium siamense]|uniref:Uncharacterized protein n=1 Tax=Dactylosporangium siamense TaxID=685454 RepID=A0A919PY75_9ACTN|nr:hypothetical protein Dsi01nite_105600 [Dactylosporangium siamense]